MAVSSTRSPSSRPTDNVSPATTPFLIPAVHREAHSGVDRRTIPAPEALERLSIGEPIFDAHITGLLDLDPLVVSRWVCGEDLRGVYQPIAFHNCDIDQLDLGRRTFYEMVEIVGCVVGQASLFQAYFYASLLIEDTCFEQPVNARGIQSDGRLVIHNTLFAGHVDLSDLSVGQYANFSAVRFVGGTNLLQEASGHWEARFPAGLSLQGCVFRPEDVPSGFDLTSRGGVLLASGAK